MKNRAPHTPEKLLPDAEHLYSKLNQASDASSVIVGVSYVDACLASLLSKRLMRSSVADKLLDSRSGVIGSFAARSDLAYVLALIDKNIYQDLKILSELRNEVAHHHFELTFESDVVVDHCRRLSFVAAQIDAGTGLPLFTQDRLASARSIFVLTVVMTVIILLLIAQGESHAKRSA